ncbi:MAG TPA: hypothetical protein VFP92_03525 [Rhodanobacteraceae bacterium]|nr:hypothetical protein [Rhodanobacteraceae bacterium]
MKKKPDSSILVIPGLPAQRADRTRNPPFHLHVNSEAWIPGSIADAAGNGPGMTKSKGTSSP